MKNSLKRRRYARYNQSTITTYPLFPLLLTFCVHYNLLSVFIIAHNNAYFHYSSPCFYYNLPQCIKFHYSSFKYVLDSIMPHLDMYFIPSCLVLICIAHLWSGLINPVTDPVIIHIIPPTKSD